jgi:hypothetical protein
MRLALLTLGAAALFFVVPATSALGTVDQFRDSDHHEVFTTHDFNICGNPGTFTFDVTSHLHTVSNDNTFVFDFNESYTYTIVFDDPALGTWTAHASESTHFVANRSGTVFQDIFNSREGSIQIIQHRQFHTDADGNATVVRTFEKIGDC